MTKDDMEEKKILEEIYKSEAKDMEGKSFWYRHKSSILILILTALGMIFCAVWSHYFPYGIW